MTNSIIESFVKEYKIDKRMTVIDLTIKDNGQVITIDGLLQDQVLKTSFLDYCRKKLSNAIVEKIDIVNHPGKKTKGLIRVSVANLHKDHSLSSPLVTQALMGTVVTVIKNYSDWSYIQLPDGYLGWISETVVVLTEETFRLWLRAPKVIVTDLHGWIHSSVEIDRTVSDTVIGNVFTICEELDTHYKIDYPDGRVGFVKKESVQFLENWLNSRVVTEQSIVETAKCFTGIPYLWGGTSSKAVDCSGFAWLVYFLNGLQLPRDADQQVEVGKEVAIDSEFTHVLPGDLLFFGRKELSGTNAINDLEEIAIPITHVGISLGGKRYMQASGDVHFSSFDPADQDFDKRRSESLLRIRRVGKDDNSHGVRKFDKISGLFENRSEKE
jgi:hypothetical protein